MNPDLLSQLRDIHASPALRWWPPAPGWWLLALLISILLFWLGRVLLARYRVHQRRKRMLQWIDELNANVDPQREPQVYLSTLNRIFKLVALRAFPEQRCALMSGDEWVAFLRAKIHHPSTEASLVAMISGPYQSSPQFDADSISLLARIWVRRYG